MEKQRTIRQVNPGAGYLAHKEEIDAAIARVMESGRYILGPEVAAFEQEFAAYLGVKFGIGVGSGTEALHLALRACGLGPGDEVITVSQTAVATAAAIELCGARPVFVDIDPETLLIDPRRIEKVITSRTKVILPVHLYGNVADMRAVLSVAHRHGLRVVEDCAQSHGASYEDRKSGAWGTLAAFSFYPTKNLGAFGDGGMVVTSDAQLDEQVRLLREYGWRQRHHSEIPGLNSRLDELQAAILRVKLKHLDRWNEGRRRRAQIYASRLEGTGIRCPVEQRGASHVYHLFVVRTRERDSLQAFLKTRGIETLVHYPVPIHLQRTYQKLGYREGDLPVTEQSAKEVLSLPLYPEIEASEIHEVAAQIRRFGQGDSNGEDGSGATPSGSGMAKTCT